MILETMNQDNLAVAVYNSHTEAESAIKELENSGFDMKKLSIIGRVYHTDEHVVGYYNSTWLATTTRATA